MFKYAKKNASHERVSESLNESAKAYSTSTTSFLHAICLSIVLEELEEPNNQTLVLKRLSEIDSLMSTVRPWFTSDSECWSWFMKEQLEAFSRLTPSEIARRYQGRGISALYEWAEERESGSFQ